MIFEQDVVFSTAKAVLITMCTLGMMFSLTEFKCTVKRALCFFVPYFVWVVVSTSVVLSLWGYDALLRVFLLTISLPAVVITYFLARYTPAQAVFNYTTQIVVSLMLTMTVTILNTQLGGTRTSDLLLRTAFYALVMLVEMRCFRKPFRALTQVLQQGWGALCCIPISFCILITVIGVYPRHFYYHRPSILYLYLIGVILCVTYFSVFRSLTVQCRLQLSARDGDVLALQVDKLRRHVDTLQENERALSIERHDMRHRLRTLAALMGKGDMQAALEYLGVAEQQMRPTRTESYCADPVLDAILVAYFDQARQAGIALELQLEIPNVLPVDAAELSTVFANALENAIAACAALPQAERRIVCKCIAAPRFMFEIANPCAVPPEFDAQGLPRAQQPAHGLGVRSIAAFAQKHSAVCSFRAQDGWFRLQLAL